jgi:transposase
MNQHYDYHLGIDLHKKTSFWTLMDNDRNILYKKNLSTSKQGILQGLREINIEPRRVQAAIEPVSQWSWYGDLLKEHGMAVNLVNPFKTKLIAETKLKNDKVDAAILAELLRCDFLPTSYYAPKEVRNVRNLSRWRLFLSRLRTRIKNRIHQILARQGIYSTWSDPFGKGGKQFIMNQNLLHGAKREIDELLEFLDRLDMAVGQRDREIDAYLKSQSESAIIMSIPGIGPVTAIMMLSEIGEYARFKRSEQLANFAGLHPASYSSGEHARMGRITRYGNEHLRTIMVEAAHRVRPTWGALYEFFLRVKEKKGSKKASVALARKMLVLSWHLIRKNELYRPNIVNTYDGAKR